MKQQTPRISAHVFKGKGHSFEQFKAEFLQAAKALFLDEQFMGVADLKKTRLAREGHHPHDIELAIKAWNSLMAAMPQTPEKAILTRDAHCRSRRSKSARLRTPRRQKARNWRYCASWNHSASDCTTTQSGASATSRKEGQEWPSWMIQKLTSKLSCIPVSSTPSLERTSIPSYNCSAPRRLRGGTSSAW